MCLLVLRFKFAFFSGAQESLLGCGPAGLTEGCRSDEGADDSKGSLSQAPSACIKSSGITSAQYRNDGDIQALLGAAELNINSKIFYYFNKKIYNIYI